MKRYQSIHRFANRPLVLLLLILVVGAIYGTIDVFQKNTMKQRKLVDELAALRNAVLVHSYINHRYPDSLEDIAKETKSFIPDQILKRNFEDPFGGKYIYDSKSGWVGSSSKKYSKW